MTLEGRRIEIRGVVQGVGFRPWVWHIANDLGVHGRVRNDPSGVTIEAFAPASALDKLLTRLRDDPPPGAEIRELAWTRIAPEVVGSFEIEPSVALGDRRLSIPPDLATCPSCLFELFDPGNRRYRFPFTNCSHCGPRNTIAGGVPYDRENTSMTKFPMCDACRYEYEDPSNRRYHAQPNACPFCGPKLFACTPDGNEVVTPDAIRWTAGLLLEGRTVAIKGLGGFHLACDATSTEAVLRLRERKHREEKPFAVMVADLAAAESAAILSDAERALLIGMERPVVLVERRPGCSISTAVAPDSHLLGLLLPYTPLHHLLLADTGRALVMTSGNLSEEPMVYRNDEAVTKLGGIADAFLLHDRDIVCRTDDSIVRTFDGVPTLLRRARGWVPKAISVKNGFRTPILACGASLKSTVCIGAGDSAWMSGHIGDLENVETLLAFEETIARMTQILDVVPQAVACDLHPDYLSTRWAKEQSGLPVIGVQHHHAHIAACMAEHGLDGPVLGLAWDGTGYGTRGELWGGELLLADAWTFERLATLRPIRLAGSHVATRQVWRIALALLDDAFGGEPPLHAIPLFRRLPRRALDVVHRMVRENVHCPPAHGAGRYFDAMGAILLDRADSNFEGQVAMAVNQVADVSETRRYPIQLHRTAGPVEIDLRPMVRAAVGDLIEGRATAEIAARFHNTLAAGAVEAIQVATARTGRLPVVLSGGVFQNNLLTQRVISLLGKDHPVHVHRNVPPGDGGISLGQAIVADAVLRRGGDRSYTAVDAVPTPIPSAI